MTRYVVDTNVPIVANGRADGDGGGRPSARCQAACIKFLKELLRRHRVLLDQEGAIQDEYHRHLNPRGQPGVGDRFYLEVINSSLKKVERIPLPKRADGEYEHLPQAVIDAGFDPSDRKFAAIACLAKAPVASGTDSDWLNHHGVLTENGVAIEYVCGCRPGTWFDQ